MTTDTTPIKVFYSYAHEDEALRKTLETHLSTLKRQSVVQEWHDRCIAPGQEWAKAIDQNLESADLILLLVSADFLASDYCHEVELRRAMERHETGEARVIPVILRAVDWTGALFGKLRCLPTDARPVTSWPNQDEAFADIAQGIRQAVAEIQAAPGPRLAAAELRRRYLRLMLEEWNTLRLQALDSAAGDTRTRPVALEQVYVDLDTLSPRPKSLYRRDKADYEQPPLTAVEALCHAEQRRLVLLGQPGSGKSTFARYLSLALAESLLGAEAASLSMQLPDWSGPVLFPVMVPLGRLTAGLKGDGAEDVAAGIQAFIATNRDLQRYGLVLLQELRQDGGLVIFDGLDEVPSARRAQVKVALNRFAAVYTRCRVMVTCRTHSYQQDAGWQLAWPVYELAPFSDAKINAFIAGWYGALGRRDPGRETSYQQKASTLQAALAPNDPRGLLELARTPLLLTVMAIVHAHKELPGSRVAVYRECVELLLLRWQKSRAEEGGRQSLLETLAAYGVTERQLEQGLCEVAYRAHEVGEADRLGGGGRALVSEDILRGILHRWFQKTEAAVADFLDYCQHANGLLLAQGTVATVTDGAAEAVYAFPHLSFEEYLAARHLRRLRLPGITFTRHAAELAGEPNWREVVRFLGEYLCHDKEGGDIVYAQDLLTRLCPVRQPTNDADWRRNWLAGELLPALRQEAAEPERDEALEARITGRLVALLQASSALRDAHQDRAAVGRALARVGDPRPGVGLGAEGLPDFQWVRIPGTATVRANGQFPNFTGLRLGNGARPDLEESTDKTWWLGKEDWPASAKSPDITDFELAVYPVTVAQFRPFVERGYHEDRWWSEAGRHYRGDRTQPYLWDDPVWMLDNHPVVGVTWYDVEAYCNWLNERLHLPPRTIRLLTEAEWEWAFRGPEGRRYPWGDEWEAWRCNSSESGINRTSAVGCFPDGAADWWQKDWPTEEVLHDLAGNVWEWTASEYSEDYSTAHQSVLNTDHSVDRPCVVRGGSWYNVPEWLRGAARHWNHPRLRFDPGGFRLART